MEVEGERAVETEFGKWRREQRQELPEKADHRVWRKFGVLEIDLEPPLALLEGMQMADRCGERMPYRSSRHDSQGVAVEIERERGVCAGYRLAPVQSFHRDVATEPGAGFVFESIDQHTRVANTRG